MDYLNDTADEQGVRVGKMIVLPSSFKGSPRCCQQGYQDSMAMVRNFGKPDYFITFTCNPNWPEITRNLKEGQTPVDRPDLVSRVFKLKLKELIDDIKKKERFGKVLAYTYVVEYQKRGKSCLFVCNLTSNFQAYHMHIFWLSLRLNTR